MTIPSTPRRAGPLLGNGSQTAFPFTFKVFTGADIAVTAADSAGTETLLVLDTDYTVALNPNQDTSPGGTVTYPISGSPLATGATLTIVGAIDYEQPLDIPTGGNFNPVAIENELDRQVMMIQQLAEVQERALRAPVSASADLELPMPEANKVIGWNATGDELINVDSSVLATIAATGTAQGDIFSGDGTTTAFTLTTAPGSIYNLDVSIDGVVQKPGDDFVWTSGTTLTFTSAPPAGSSNIFVRYMRALPQAGQVIPDVAGQAGKVLGNNGVTLQWVADATGGAGGASNGIDITAAPYSADNTGVNDIATALAAAFAACPVGGMIVLPAGGTYKLSTVNMDGKPVTVYAVGATINCTSSTGALLKTDHGNTLTVIGGRWLGASGARILRYNATASGVMYADMVVSHAYFRSRDHYAVDLRGCREVSFSQCVFETENASTAAFAGGVYLNQANNPYFSHCYFIGRGKGTGFFADGAGSPNSANPVLDCCEVLGWDVGVKIVGCDDGAMISCTVDYNITANTYISSQDVFKIDGCYLGGGIDGISNVPALTITSEGGLGYGPDVCRFITVSNTHFVGHQTAGNLLDLLLITGPTSSYYSTNLVVQSCHFQQYTRRGINYAVNGGALLIANNTFVPIGGGSEPTVSTIYNSSGATDTQVLVTGNHFPAGTTLSGAALSRTRVHNNLGHGTAVYMSRSGTTTPELSLVADRGTVLAQTDGLYVKGGSDGTNAGWVKLGSGSGVTRSYVYAHTSTQAFNSHPSTLTKVVFQVEAEDARGEWDGSNFVAVEAGDYLVNCVMVGTAAGNFALNEQFRVDLFRDDFRLHAGVAANAQTSTPVNPQTSVNAVVPLTAGGKIDVRVFNNCTGGAITASGTQFSTWITIKRLS